MVFFPSGFYTTIVYAFIISFIHAACATHLILPDFITLIIYLVKHTNYEAHNYKVFSIFMLFLLSLLGSNIVFSTILLNTLNCN
jgi:hypothetical protein